MADAKVSIIITAKDEASKVFRGLSDVAGTAFKGAMLGATVGIGAFTAGIGLAVSEALDAEKNIAKLEAVIKSTGGVAGITSEEAQSLADSLSSVTTFSDDAVLSAETMLLTFKNIGEDVFPQATESVLNMAEMFGGADQAAIQLGKALNDPLEGISALTRVGVTFNENQKETIKQFMETGQVAEAQKIILKELESEFGGVARASGDTLAGKLTILKNQLLNVAEGVGTVLLPPLTKFLESVVLPLIPKVQHLGQALGQVFEVLLDADLGFFTSEMYESFQWLFGQDLGKELYKIASVFVEFGQSIANFVTGTLVPFVKDHAESFKKALIAIGAVLAAAGIISGVMSIVGALAALVNPVTLVIAAVAGLAYAWEENFLGIRDVVSSVWDSIKPALEAFRRAFNVLVGAFKKGGLEQVIRSLFGGSLFKNLLKTLGLSEGAAQKLGDIFRKVFVEFILGQVIPAVDKFVSGIMNIIDWIGKVGIESEVVRTAIQSVFGSEFGSVIFEAVNYVVEFVSTFIDHIGNIIDLLTSGNLKGAFGEFVNMLKDAAGQVVDWLSYILPIVGQKLLDLGQKFLEWVLPLIPPLLSKLGELAQRLVKWIGDQLPIWVAKLKEWGGAFIDWILPFIPPLLTKLGELAQKLTNWIGEKAPTVLDKLGEWGQKFIDWVVPATQGLLAKIPGLLTDLLGWASDALPPIAEKMLEWGAEFVRWAGDAIPPLLEKLGELLGDVVEWIVGTAIPGIVAEIPGLVSALISFAGEAITQIGPKLLEFLTTIQNIIVNDIIPAVLRFGGDIARGLIDGLKQGISNLAGEIGQAIEDLLSGLPDIAKKVLGISSPSKVFKGIGANVAEGLALGIKQSSSPIKALGDLSKQLIAPRSSPTYAPAMAGMDAPRGRAGSTRTTSNTYNLTINSNSAQERALDDFNLMRAWSGA
jgi:hypothetical protein